MIKKTTTMMAAALALLCGTVFAEPFGNAKATTRYPWNGFVDIECTVSGITTPADTLVVLQRVNQANGEITELRNVSLNGIPLGGVGISLSNGEYHFVWDAAANLGESAVLDDVAFRVSFKQLYCVIDLSGGANATGYPVSYLPGVPSGGWTDEYKTTKLVLRRIPAGIFMMGSPSDELGRDSRETQHQVTLTKEFWIGIFEVTQRQWELVMGSNPSSYKAKVRPVERVSYNTIRGSSSGAGWPGSDDVDASSFMGKLRSKVPELKFDLPTEAQWEYACRAGTTTALNSGKNLTGTSSCDNLAEVGRYSSNKGDGKGRYDTHTTVGSYEPNAWGLYDMHGNVFEWCLDWYGSYGSTETDPVGVSSGSRRVLRGGSWGFKSQYCRSANCTYLNSGENGNNYGLRLAASSEGDLVEGDLVVVNSNAVKVDTRTGVREKAAVERIQWDSRWYGDSLCAVRVSVNGEVLVDSFSDDSYPYGVYKWRATRNGDYALRHETIRNGQVIDTQTASFRFAGIRIEEDANAFVDGSEEEGYVVRPSGGVSTVTLVAAPGIDAGTATLELGRDVKRVAPNGAKIKIVRGGHDITGHFTLPDADASGIVDLSGMKVKPEIAREAIDPGMGGIFQIVDGEPFLRTAPTRPGLAYSLREGFVLGNMVNGDSTVGDGNVWTPSIRVKGGASGFYSIAVSPDPLPAQDVPSQDPADSAQLIYMVVDLSEGTSAESYPVSYLADVPPGGWTDEYKTEKFVLRRIPAGTFMMGSPSNELGRNSDETQHQVTLTKDYWIGVFEVTQRQWELVMGNKPSYFNNASYYATRPVERVSYDVIRGSSSGAGWPGSDAVDASSFMGKLRSKVSGLKFDLPTEAQWEYACRAGTTTALNNGKNLTRTSSCTNLAEVGRYEYNGGGTCFSSATTSEGTAKVGSYAPNAWGLYDMHGNVWECCLDWYGAYGSTATDPVGASLELDRVLRGGCWDYSSQNCRSAIRSHIFPSHHHNGIGLRVAASPEVH